MERTGGKIQRLRVAWCPGGGTRSRTDSMCGQKSGVEKWTLTVTRKDLKSDPYSDLCDTLDTLTLTFICNF